MSAPPRFGTDGLRGKAGQPPMDAPTLRRVGAALGALLRGRGEHDTVLLGHDGRSSAAWIRDALAVGLATADMRSADLGLLTTPALAYLTCKRPTAAGIMISASHNPATDNGIKIFGPDGTKLPDADEREIETRCESLDVGEGAAECEPCHDLVADYRAFLTATFAGLELDGLTVVLDAAHGGGSEMAPEVLRSFGARVVATGCEPTGDNINDGVGALYPHNLVDTVRSERAALGICLDGDGDRGIFVDHEGTVRDGDEVMFAFARHLDAGGSLPQHTLVATVMSNLGLHRALERDGITVHTTPVGDRSVVRAMREHGFTLGGEQSGHIVFAHPDHCTGDGLFTALQLLSLPGARQGSSALFDGFRRYPQVLLNVPVHSKPDLSGLPDVQAAVAEVEGALGRDGRVVLRYSGTEDLCRVMVEGPEQDIVQRHADHIAAAVRQALS